MADEVWIKVARTKEAWTFGFLTVSPESRFISLFDYMARRDEVSLDDMGKINSCIRAEKEGSKAIL